MTSFFKGNYVSSKEAMKLIGVERQTLRNWDKEGKIKTIRSPAGTRYYDAEEFIRNKKIEEERIEAMYNKKKNRVKVYCGNIKKETKKKYPKYEILDISEESIKKIIDYGTKNKLDELILEHKEILTEEIDYELLKYILEKNAGTKISIEREENKEEIKKEMMKSVEKWSNKLVKKMNEKSG